MAENSNKTWKAGQPANNDGSWGFEDMAEESNFSLGPRSSPSLGSYESGQMHDALNEDAAHDDYFRTFVHGQNFGDGELGHGDVHPNGGVGAKGNGASAASKRSPKWLLAGLGGVAILGLLIAVVLVQLL